MYECVFIIEKNKTMEWMLVFFVFIRFIYSIRSKMCIENAITFTESLAIPGLWFIEWHLSVQLIVVFVFIHFVVIYREIKNCCWWFAIMMCYNYQVSKQFSNICSLIPLCPNRVVKRFSNDQPITRLVIIY